MVKRGEIWLVNLDPTMGSEIRKSRPCVVISPSEMHDHLRTLIVAPMTSKSRLAPFRVPVTHAGQKGWILLDQLRAVDKVYIGRPAGGLCRMSAIDPGGKCAKLPYDPIS